jgi:hypothetical protein
VSYIYIYPPQFELGQLGRYVLGMHVLQGWSCLGTIGNGGDHVGLEKRGIEEDLMVAERLQDGGEDALRGGGAGPDVVPGED